MAVCIGYLMNMTVPRSGEISRALVLKKYNDVPFDKGFGSIIAERIIDKEISWVLSDAELHDSRYWEKIHIKNVDDDVNKAKKKFLV